MYRRSCFIVLSCLVLLCAAVAQRRGSVSTRPGASLPTANDLSIKITYDNERAASGQAFRVLLVNATGIPVAETFSDTEGQAHFANVLAGRYQIRVNGPTIEDASTDTFEINGPEGMHLEYVRVKLKAGSGSAVAAGEPTVSAANLNVPDKARKEFDKGNEAAHKDDFHGAQQHYRKAAEIYPQFEAAQNNLGLMCLQAKDYGCARAAFQKTVDINPRSASALRNLGRLELMAKNFPEAESLLQKSVVVEPENPQTLTLLANTELALHKFPETVLYARKVHAIPHEGFGVAHFLAGTALEAEGGHEQEAVVEFQTFLRESPQSPFAARARDELAHLSNHASTSTPQP